MDGEHGYGGAEPPGVRFGVVIAGSLHPAPQLSLDRFARSADNAGAETFDSLKGASAAAAWR
jgi:hypothetical protein